MAGGAARALLVAGLLAPLAVLGTGRGRRERVHYTNHFAVLVPGGRLRAQRAAQQHGCSLVDSIGDLTDHYLLECHSVSKRAAELSHQHISQLRDSEDIAWADQQYYKKRKKRDGSGGGFFSSMFRQLSQPLGFEEALGLRPRGVSESQSQQHTAARRSIQSYWPDPLFKEQWYLNGGAKDGSDMNVIPAWQRGYSGKGVVVSILDDGIQPNHPDLADNYDGMASLDINDNDEDPTPRDDGGNRHGTRCAGEVAALAGNTICGVGVAPNASIGGVRMLDGGVNDYVEAKALSYHRNHIDIYSASWGPEDDGKTVDGPGPLARRAFIEGVLKGRGGKGSIFVWASGNGGQYVDNCNCDGYTNSIFTLSISSASQGGRKPWYLEECASTLATTYSSGTPLQDKSIATCDQDAALRPKHICTVSHTGTSASAPLAAGLCALALEANPSLTWRDMQYIVLMTSRYEPLAQELTWLTNGVGRRVSHKFGYGLMDGAAMVELAKQWTSVPAQHICITPIDSRTRMIPSEYGGQLLVSMEVSACQGTPQTVNYLEHVQCKVTLTYIPRGNLRILLTSPAGTISTLLFERPRDVIGSSFDRWPFMSVHFWGENPRGVWNLTVLNAQSRTSQIEGVLKEWQLILYGAEQQPIRLKSAAEQQFGRGPALRSSVVSRSGTPAEPAFYCSRQCVHSCEQRPAGAGCKRCREQYKSDCRRSCDPGSYYSETGGCQTCHSSCATCFGGQQNQCVRCASHYYLIVDLSVCLPVCPDGYFNMNRTCESCGPHCTSCVGSSNHCLSCASHLMLHDDSCVAACPAGTYEINQRCERCAPGCETCVGPADTNCVLCRPGLAHSDGRCVADCPEGRYLNAARAECRRCASDCHQCDGPAACRRCRPSWHLTDANSCRPPDSERCPDGEFFQSGGGCASCHSSCTTCSGPSAVDCTRCRPYTYLHNGLCYESCPEGTATEDGLCQPCFHTCRDCRTSTDRCTECRHGLLLYSQSCLVACPEGTYQSLEECVPCAPTCHTCYGGGADECVSCHSQWQLAASSCHRRCPDRYYQTADGCRRCHRTCRTCDGSELTQCRSCHDGYQLLASEGTCTPCGSRQFYESRSQRCQSCHRTCATCNGAGPKNCTSCAGALRLDSARRHCLPCCTRSQPHTEPPACCYCDSSHALCVRGTRRRTVHGYYKELPKDTSFSWFYTQAMLLCLASVACFVVIFGVLQWRMRPGRRHTPVLELSDTEEALTLTDHRCDAHVDSLSENEDGEEDHLVVYDART